MKSTKKRRAFSHTETLATVVVVGLLVAILMPMLGASRMRMRAQTSAEKLMTIGQAGMMYANDNEGRLFSYTWRAGEMYSLPDGRVKQPNSDADGALYQNLEVLQRRTGRIHGQGKIFASIGTLPHRRLAHLVLMDYMNQPFGSDLFIDPSDGKQQVWKDHPLDYGPESSVPYANGIPPGYDDDSWTDTPYVQRWAFASSYQVVPDAWQPDRGPRYIPVHQSPHRLQATGNQIPLAEGRRLRSVLHNANKVWMYEEFDRDRTQHLYFGYDHAKVEKLMFDGSVNNWESGRAAPSVVIERGYMPWEQRYVPLDKFPLPVGGLGDSAEISQRWRWTFGGLSGVNYGAFSFQD